MTIAHIENGGGSLPDQIAFAKALSDSNLLPKQYIRQPANVLLAIQLGNALGIPPIQAINGIHVVEGKPTASADLIASLVRRAGHKLRIREEQTPDGLRVTATLIRGDDPDFPFEAVWDMGKAKAAGLSGKNVWRQYPGQMLRSRAITEVARMGASDALYGVIYTSEELGGEDQTTSVVQAEDRPAPTVSPATSFEEAMEADSTDAAQSPEDIILAAYGTIQAAKTAGEEAGFDLSTEDGRTGFAAYLMEPELPSDSDVVDGEVVS